MHSWACCPCSNVFVVVAGRDALVGHLSGLTSRKVLVVVDDTDDVAQLRNLLPQCELHPGSLVIITSRKESILARRCKIVSQVQLLPVGRDMQLFRAWAFAAGQPVWDTSALVSQVVACCGQLPLTLKVGIAYAATSVMSTYALWLWKCRFVSQSEGVARMLAGHGRPHEFFERT